VSFVEVDISMSVDGFITGPDIDEYPGLGKGGEVLHAWFAVIQTPNTLLMMRCSRPQELWSRAASHQGSDRLDELVTRNHQNSPASLKECVAGAPAQ
jgi:hypothetical protein